MAFCSVAFVYQFQWSEFAGGASGETDPATIVFRLFPKRVFETFRQ